MRRSRSALGPPSPRSVRSTASSAAGCALPDFAASATICASRTGRASPRIALPLSVSRPSASIAPRSRRRARASSSAGFGGGSRNESVETSATPKAAASRTRPERSASRISGGVKAGNAAVCSARHKRMATPGWVRPARPARWSAEARETRTVSSRVSPVAGSYFGSRDRPLSTTTRTPSMVSEVSAMDVASTILRRPAGAGLIAASCVRASRLPNSGTMSALAGTRPPSRSAVRSISRWPGRKARIDPSSFDRAPRIARATASSTGSSGPRSSWRMSTGKLRPSLSITAASPSSRATRAPSMVADMTSSRRSGRSAPCTSIASARPKSPSSERSWNSSNRIAAMPVSSGSSRIIRASTPSVTTRMRVLGPTLLSMRIA